MQNWRGEDKYLFFHAKNLLYKIYALASSFNYSVKVFPHTTVPWST